MHRTLLAVGLVTLLSVAFAILLIRRLHREVVAKRAVPTDPVTHAAFEEGQEATRRHVSAAIDSVRNDTKVSKTNAHILVRIIRRVANALGVKSDDIQ